MIIIDWSITLCDVTPKSRIKFWKCSDAVFFHYILLRNTIFFPDAHAWRKGVLFLTERSQSKFHITKSIFHDNFYIFLNIFSHIFVSYQTKRVHCILKEISPKTIRFLMPPENVTWPYVHRHMTWNKNKKKCQHPVKLSK